MKDKSEDYLNKLNRLLDSTDLIMLDIKHIDREEHIKLTAQDNTNILKFARYVDDYGVQLWIRHVVVPGITFNDTYLCKSAGKHRYNLSLESFIQISVY